MDRKLRLVTDRTDPPKDITSPGLTQHQTWLECLRCGATTADAVPTPGVLHRYGMCYACVSGENP